MNQVTYSQADMPKFKSHNYFAFAVVKSFSLEIKEKVIHWYCCREKNLKSKEYNITYILALKLDR